MAHAGSSALNTRPMFNLAARERAIFAEQDRKLDAAREGKLPVRRVGPPSNLDGKAVAGIFARRYDE